jgi:hypothetical protein
VEALQLSVDSSDLLVHSVPLVFIDLASVSLPHEVINVRPLLDCIDPHSALIFTELPVVDLELGFDLDLIQNWHTIVKSIPIHNLLLVIKPDSSLSIVIRHNCKVFIFI